MSRPFHHLLLFGLLAALGGCGLKGPLHMPSAHPDGNAQRKAAHAPGTSTPAPPGSVSALPPNDDDDSTGAAQQ